MENSIPALIIGGIMILSAALLAHVTQQSVDDVGESWREIQVLSEDRLGTQLAVVSASTSGNDVLTIQLRNDGRTPIADFTQADVIINYNGSGNQRINRWLPNTEAGTQPDNTWKVTSFTNDKKNPGILDGGETMTIRIEVNPNFNGSASRWVSFATESGVTYNITF